VIKERGLGGATWVRVGDAPSGLLAFAAAGACKVPLELFHRTLYTSAMERPAPISGLKWFQSLVEECEGLVRRHGSLSAREVDRREELALIISEFTGQVSRNAMLRRAHRILENPSLFAATERRRAQDQQAQYQQRLAPAQSKRPGAPGPQLSRPREFDADKVRKIIPTSMESNRRNH
jgi:hypothetical protein